MRRTLVTAVVLAAVAEPPQTTSGSREVDLSGLLPPSDESEPGVRTPAFALSWV